MKWYDQEDIRPLHLAPNDQTGEIVGYAVAITLLAFGFILGLTIGWWLL